jgi:hypothetical protein
MFSFKDVYTIPDFVHNTADGDLYEREIAPTYQQPQPLMAPTPSCIVAYTLLSTWSTDHHPHTVRAGASPHTYFVYWWSIITRLGRESLV